MGIFDNILDSGNSNTSTEILNKFFDQDQIETKTELTDAQIKVLVKQYWFSLRKEQPKLSASEMLKKTMNYYMILKVSLKRKSRDEVIKGLGQLKEIEQQESLLSQMNKK